MLTLELSGNLKQYNAADRHGDPRTRGQILNADCHQVITEQEAPWRGLTFEQAVQAHPDECDDIVDAHDKDMHRQQIRLRVYLTLRRQLLEALRRVKALLRKQKDYVSSLD